MVSVLSCCSSSNFLWSYVDTEFGQQICGFISSLVAFRLRHKELFEVLFWCIRNIKSSRLRLFAHHSKSFIFVCTFCSGMIPSSPLCSTSQGSLLRCGDDRPAVAVCSFFPLTAGWGTVQRTKFADLGSITWHGVDAQEPLWDEKERYPEVM